MMRKINTTPSSQELKQFGRIMIIGFGLIGFLLLWRGHIFLAMWMWGGGFGIWLCTLISASVSRYLYLVWMVFGFVIGSVMSRVIMLIIYYGIITPVALIFKLQGRDELLMKDRRTLTPSYWRDHARIDKTSYEHLF